MAETIDNVIFSSDLTNTFKNFDTSSASISVPSTSYSAGQYKTYSTSINLEESNTTTEVFQNFSIDSTKHYYGAFVQVSVDANFIAQTRMRYSGTTLNIDCYVVNTTGGTVNNTAFTLDIEVRRFTTPFTS